MSSFLTKLRANRLERWKGTREKGKWHYVPGFALYFSLSITVSYTVVSVIFEEQVNIFGVTIRLILNFLLGLLVGWSVWNSNEKTLLANASAYYPWGYEKAKDPEKFEEQFRNDFRSMPHRDVVDLTNVKEIKEKLFTSDFGEIIAAAIALIPEKYISGSYFHDEVCPLCLESTIASERLAASLQPRFEKIENLSTCIWVHKQCFEALPLRDDPPGVPW